MNIVFMLSLFLDFDDIFEGAILIQVFYYVIFVIVFVTIIASFIKARKKKSDNPDFTRPSNLHQNIPPKDETEVCEYCGGIIPKDKVECPSCGAKRKKK